MAENIKDNPKSSNEWLSFTYVVIFALLIRIFVVELFFVPTGSMKLTILENDYIFSTKYSYGFSKHSFPFSPPIFKGRIFATAPERGDIVIFRPPMKMDIRYIKRLVGLPGDKIQLIDDLIYINDQPIKREEMGVVKDEKGNSYEKYKETLPNEMSYYSYKTLQKYSNSAENKFGNTEIFYVPSDKYFFLGDNRDESNDSRVDLGFVPFENFIAKGQLVFFSTKDLLWLEDGPITQVVTRAWTWLSSIRINRIFKSIYATD
ncbi:MAG: signal peptidase I [Janthinobacterium lividum]